MQKHAIILASSVARPSRRRVTALRHLEWHLCQSGLPRRTGHVKATRRQLRRNACTRKQGSSTYKHAHVHTSTRTHTLTQTNIYLHGGKVVFTLYILRWILKIHGLKAKREISIMRAKQESTRVRGLAGTNACMTCHLHCWSLEVFVIFYWSNFISGNLYINLSIKLYVCTSYTGQKASRTIHILTRGFII